MTTRTALMLAAIGGFCAVAIGAFGAHGLEDRIDDGMLQIYETGVRYHIYHVLALLGIAPIITQLGRLGSAAGWCFVVGVLVFSGTLYALALTGQRWLGAVTPVGGLVLMAGWACLGIAALRWRAKPGNQGPVSLTTERPLG